MLNVFIVVVIDCCLTLVSYSFQPIVALLINHLLTNLLTCVTLCCTNTFYTKPTHSHRVCLFVGDSAGVMYWGDSQLDRIEKAYLNGTGRTVLLTETRVHYSSFVFHAGNIYITDWHYQYDCRLFLFVEESSKIV